MVDSNPTTWRDASPRLIQETLDRIDMGRGLYAVERFPDEVASLVRRDFFRHFSGGSPQAFITDEAGRNPEALNAVFGLDLARRIADELELQYTPASGRTRELRRIKYAVVQYLGFATTPDEDNDAEVSLIGHRKMAEGAD